MRKRKMTIQTYFLTKAAGVWPVDVEFETDTLGTKVGATMDTICEWLQNYGFTPRFVGQIPEGTLPAEVNESSGQTSIDYGPTCPTHGGAMKMSQYKTKNGKEQWYCPQKDGGDYCKEKWSEQPAG